MPDIWQAPQLNPFPGKRTVVVMDNCAIHHNEEIQQLIENECGASYHTLITSPYSNCQVQF
jgi:transposase